MTQEQLKVHLDFIREMQNKTKNMYKDIENVKSDDARSLCGNYDRLLHTCKSFLMHHYDCECPF